MKRSIRNRGVATIWVAATVMLLLLVIGLAVDIGHVYRAGQELQFTADASALAAVWHVREDHDAARSAGVQLAAANGAVNVGLTLDPNDANKAAGDLVIGVYRRIDARFTPADNTNAHLANAVMVRARRMTGAADGPVDLIFGPMVGIDGADASRWAIAMIKGGRGAGVIALNETEPCALRLSGTSGSLVVNDGAVYVNSNHASAACHSGKPHLEAIDLFVAGGTDGGFESQIDFDGEVWTDSDPIPDPLATLPDPVYDPSVDLGGVNVTAGATQTLTPGYYSGGIQNKNGTVNCAPGVYVVAGAGLNINGGNLYANGCTFFILDGPIDINGNGEIEMSPPDSAAYPITGGPDATAYETAGVTIFQARTNTTDSRFLGNSNTVVGGTLYMPEAHLEVGGTSDSFSNGIIADTLWVHGTGDLQVNYDGRFGTIDKQVFLIQ